MTETTRRLKMQNENNKLACDGFLQIHFAPRGIIADVDYEKVYEIPLNDTFVLAHLVDFLRLPFKFISTIYTIPATGLESFEWKKAWKEKYPSTTDETLMAIYCYKRLKE